jgi:hypothetical protein
MKILRALKIPWLETLGHLVRGLGWFAKSVAMLGTLCLLATVALWWSRGCYAELLAHVPGVSGFNFEVSTTDCWHNPETGVFVSRPGQRRKTLLFLYDSLEVPAITSIDERTVQITIGNIDQVFCRRDKLENLTIKYDIRGIRFPGSSPACSSEQR